MIVREARLKDVSAIADLERATYGMAGTAVYEEDHVLAWLQTNPEFLLVTEDEGRVVAYTYAQAVNFDPKDLSSFQSLDESTDQGYTKLTHQKNGNAIYGTNVSSIKSGAGSMVMRAILQKTKHFGFEFYIGFSRINFFSEFYEKFKSLGYEERDLALWYIHECVTMTDKAWLWDLFPSKPSLEGLTLQTIDPVLKLHTKLGQGVIALLRGYMTDPQSRDWNVMVATPRSHLP